MIAQYIIKSFVGPFSGSGQHPDTLTEKDTGSIQKLCFTQGGAAEIHSLLPIPFLKYLWPMTDLEWEREKEFGVGWYLETKGWA